VKLVVDDTSVERRRVAAVEWKRRSTTGSEAVALICVVEWGPKGGAPATLPSFHTWPHRQSFFPTSAFQTEVLHRTKAKLHASAQKPSPIGGHPRS
jgi:hypothetical protein